MLANFKSCSINLLGGLLLCAPLFMSAAEVHIDFSTPDALLDLDMEEVIVRAEREGSTESDRQAFLAHRKAMILYARGDYEAALPYLIAAARNGYKDSQARLAHLYLHGLGGLRRSDKSGIGWMGAAAYGETTPIIQRRFDELMAAVPHRHMETIKAVVEAYVEKYGQYEQNVVCEVAAHASSRIAKNRCYFDYEFTVMSSNEIADMNEYYKDKIIDPQQWSSFQLLDNFNGNVEMPPQQSSRPAQ